MDKIYRYKLLKLRKVMKQIINIILGQYLVETTEGSAFNILPYSSQCSLSSAQTYLA